MKVLALVAILGALAYAKDGDADCHVFGVGDYGSCGMQVKDVDLGADCRYNGDTPPSTACVTAAKNTPADCGKCFKVTMEEKGAPKGTPGCGANGCPAYSRSVLVYVIDLTGKADYEVAQNGWAGKNGVCPGVCAHTSYCSESASDCQYGWLADAGAMLSGCYSNSKHITHEEVECPNGSGGSKPSGGGETEKPATTNQPSSGGETSPNSGGSETTVQPATSAKPEGSTEGSTKGSTEGSTAPSTGGGDDFECPSAGFFPHTDKHKFIQCAWAGKPGYVKSCGPTLVWNQKILNCDWA